MSHRCRDVIQVDSDVIQPLCTWTPELVLVWSERPVFPGPRVPSAVSEPHVVPGVRQHVSQTGVWRVGDPVTAGGEEAMLEQDRRPRACST